MAYIGGPYTSGALRKDGTIDCFKLEQNVLEAQSVSLAVHRAGHYAICPHAEARHYFGTLPEAHFIGYGLALLRLCQALILVGGTRALVSKGTRGEVAEAIRFGIPIYLSVSDFLIDYRAEVDDIVQIARSRGTPLPIYEDEPCPETLPTGSMPPALYKPSSEGGD